MLLYILVQGQHVPKSNYQFKSGFSMSDCCVKKKFTIPKVIPQNLYKAYTQDLTVEITLASQLEQTEFVLHNVDQLELNKAHFCITPLAGVVFE